MRILLIAATAVDTSDIPLFLKAAFERRGDVVCLVSPQEDSTFVMRALERNKLLRSWSWLSSFGRKVMKAAARCKPEMVIVYGSNFYVRPTVLAHLKRRFHCRLVLWEGNIQFWTWYQGGAVSLYDHCFALDSYLIPLLRGPAQKQSVWQLGAGCDPQEHRMVTLSARDRERFGADVTFVGHGFPERISLIEGIECPNLKLWGKLWARSPKLRACFRDEPVDGLKKTKIYNASKIVINIQNPVSQINGLSCRVFEVLACGSLPLTEWRVDVDRYFKVGGEIAVFRNADELKSQISYYLQHDKERLAIVERGRRRVLAEHTYDARVRDMVAVIDGTAGRGR